jgi:PAS domain S-box-containing protein
VTAPSEISGDALIAPTTGQTSWPATPRLRVVEPKEVATPRDFLQGTLDSLASHIAVLDEHGEIVMTNRAWSTFASDNTVAPQGIGANYLTACDAAGDDDMARNVAAGLRAIIAGTESEFTVEYPCHGPDVQCWFALRATRYQGAGSARVVVAHDNITTRRAAQDDAAMQTALLNDVDMSVIAMDPEGRITRWSDGAERLFGWTSAEAVGRNAAKLIAAVDPGRVGEVVANVQRDGHWEGRLNYTRKDGSIFPAYLRHRLMVDESGQVTGRIAALVDVTERVASEQALLAAQNYIRAVAESMGEGLYTLDPEGRIVFVNEAAEKMLGWSAQELKGRVMHDVTHSWHADGTPHLVEDCPIRRAGRDGIPVRIEDDVFTCSDGRALPVQYTASPFVTEDGVEGCAVVFEDITDRKAREQSMEGGEETLAWIGRIKEALADDRFVLYEQPIVELSSGDVVQRELLLRMREPTGDVVGPGCFLPVAEQYGLIGEIDRWVIGRATEIAAAGDSVQLNLSASTTGDPSVLDAIEHNLARTGVDPNSLVFEITETALITDEAAAKAFADRVHALGCKLALDDFGTGYGGFTYLKRFPVDLLKIDIEFVRDLPTNPDSKHVVEAVVALAQAFGLQTVAEGVEDAATLQLLRALGVDFAQGYHIARPRPVEQPVTSAIPVAAV